MGRRRRRNQFKSYLTNTELIPYCASRHCRTCLPLTPNLQAVSGASIMIRQEITIVNEQGLHARPAAEFVLAAKAFRSQIWLVKGDERFSAASILDVLTANLDYGETALIEAEGPDAEEAVKRLVRLTAEFGKRDLNSTRTAPRRMEEDF